MFDRRTNPETTFLWELATDGAVRDLVAHLEHGRTPVVRRRAAELLGGFVDVDDGDDRTRVRNALVTAVREDEDRSVQARAIDALAEFEDDGLETLVEDLADADPTVSPEWVTVRGLVDWLDADYPEFRMVAAAVLGRLGEERALPALLEAVTDSDPRVRSRVVRALGRLADPRSVDALASRLDDPDPSVRRGAARALGEVRTEAALDALVPAALDDDEQLRRVVVDQLGQFGSFKPVVVLVRSLEEGTGPVQRSAALSLVELLAAVPDGKSRRFRRGLGDRLDETTAPDAVSTLLDLVTDGTSPSRRRNATWLVSRLVSDPEGDVLDALVRGLEDADEETARLATRPLIEADGDEVDRRLRRYVEEERGTAASRDRAEVVLRERGSAPERNRLADTVEYTYVRDPADYTRRHGDGPE